MSEKRNKTGWLTVDYDGSVQETFKGLRLAIMEFQADEEKEIIEFNTGDAVVDWYNYYKFLYGGEAYEKGIFMVGGSSNVDHWFMDGDTYKEQFLKAVDDGANMVFMTEDEVNILHLDELNQSYKCVITEDIKSFEELKEYVRARTETQA